MTPEHYARVKQVFLEVEDAPEESQLPRLRALCQGDERVFEDVAKLLNHHDADAAAREGSGSPDAMVENGDAASLVGNSQSRTHTAFNWLRNRWQSYSDALTISITCLVTAVLAWLIDGAVRQHTIDRQVTELRSNVRQTSLAVDQWAMEWRMLAQQFGSRAQLVSLAQQFLKIDTDQASDALRSTPLADELDQIAKAHWGDDVRYVLWNSAGLTLASWQEDRADVGNRLPPEAMIGLTKSMAVELGRHGITANCICPGPILTGMTDEIPDDAKATYAHRRVPLRRYGTPEEVAHMTLNLCLPASSFVNGAIIPVDGGMSIRHV